MAQAQVDLVAIHQAVCDVINETLPDARTYPEWRDSVQPPCIIVTGARLNYVMFDQAMVQGSVQVNLILTLLGPVGDRAGQDQIKRWLSLGSDAGESLVTALTATDRTLNGTTPSGFKFGATRYAAALEYPAGSSARYAVGELDLMAHC